MLRRVWPEGGRVILPPQKAPASETDRLIDETINRLRNRAGWWEGDQNARRVLSEFAQLCLFTGANNSGVSVTRQREPAAQDAA